MNTHIQHKNTKKKCSFIYENGNYCNSFTMKNSNFCYMHNSDIPELEKQNARSQGGKSKVLVCNAIETNKPVKLENPKQVSKFYSKLINDIMSGTMDLRLATGIGYLLNGLLKALELSEIEGRIETIEDVISKLEK